MNRQIAVNICMFLCSYLHSGPKDFKNFSKSNQFLHFFHKHIVYPIHFAISRKKITSHYFLTLSCLDGLDESLSRAGKGAPRPKILRTRSLSERCKFMPEPKT